MLKKPKGLRACVLLLAWLMIFPLFCMAQQKRVTLDIKERPMVEIVQELRKLFDCRFLYKVDDLKQYPAWNLKVVNAPLEEVMNTLLRGTNLSWRLEDNVILIKKRKQLRRKWHQQLK